VWNSEKNSKNALLLVSQSARILKILVAIRVANEQLVNARTDMQGMTRMFAYL